MSSVFFFSFIRTCTELTTVKSEAKQLHLTSQPFFHACNWWFRSSCENSELDSDYHSYYKHIVNVNYVV